MLETAARGLSLSSSLLPTSSTMVVARVFGSTPPSAPHFEQLAGTYFLLTY
jgi:hypothetical protein